MPGLVTTISYSVVTVVINHQQFGTQESNLKPSGSEPDALPVAPVPIIFSGSTEIRTLFSRVRAGCFSY